MKAITYSNYGPPDVLRLSDVEIPEAGDDEVFIRVRAAEATKSDCELRSFRFSVNWFWLPLRLAIGITRPRKQVLGGYFSGEILAVGKNVTQFATGMQVFGATGLRFGAYGEYVNLPADSTMVAKPGNMSFEEAAAVPLGGLNAIHFMRLAELKPGEKVLINGAGGSIGAHAVQIAKSMGAEVTAVDKAIKEPFLRGLGADHFIDYQRQDFGSSGEKYDVIFDMVPRSSYRACMQSLTDQGRYFTGNPRMSVMFRTLLTNVFTKRKASFAFAKERIEELEALKEMIEARTIRPIVDQVFPMDRAAEAHRLVETEERRGAIVIAIGEPENVSEPA
ncbi:NAD(P)-dependent alcohol dehydrogenase [Hoeflea sp. TYP-13]|uniref:NAD(P)-dependent alcohol dehydrogenase n=1 Tax=Hoeflea sp. TYP-13 TaxID=3230023 RepID=UPI0034C64FA8